MVASSSPASEGWKPSMRLATLPSRPMRTVKGAAAVGLYAWAMAVSSSTTTGKV